MDVYAIATLGGIAAALLGTFGMMFIDSRRK